MVLTNHPQAIVGRVSWVFGAKGEGFLEKIFRLIHEQTPLEAVADKYSLPTSTIEIAKALDFLLKQKEHGLFHLTQSASEPVSWHSYAEEVAAAVHEIGLTAAKLPVQPQKMTDIPALRANRPIHTAMQPARLAQIGYPMQDWKVVLRERVKELHEKNLQKNSQH